jgi:hypothetical protein
LDEFGWFFHLTARFGSVGGLHSWKPNQTKPNRILIVSPLIISPIQPTSPNFISYFSRVFTFHSIPKLIPLTHAVLCTLSSHLSHEVLTLSVYSRRSHSNLTHAVLISTSSLSRKSHGFTLTVTVSHSRLTLTVSHSLKSHGFTFWVSHSRCHSLSVSHSQSLN